MARLDVAVVTRRTLMDEICAWLTANGIDSRAVPITERPIVTKDTIVIEVWDRPLRRDPATNSPVGHVHAVPLAVPPGPGVIRWLLGEVRP